MFSTFDMLQRRLIHEGARLTMRCKDFKLMRLTKDMIIEGMQILKDRKRFPDGPVGKML